LWWNMRRKILSHKKIFLRGEPQYFGSRPKKRPCDAQRCTSTW
jgi:hypothetical protein